MNDFEYILHGRGGGGGGGGASTNRCVQNSVVMKAIYNYIHCGM